MAGYTPEEKKSRRYTIFIMAGALPDRFFLLGFGFDSPSYGRDLALQADRDTDGSEFDERVEAKDTLARPSWAKGAIVLVGSVESRRLHTALEACSIVLDCRYVVVAEEIASRLFHSMARMAEQGASGRDICRRKQVIRKMRSFTVDPDDFAEHEDFAVWLRLKKVDEHMITRNWVDLLENNERGGKFANETEEAIDARVRAEMHEYIMAGSVPWTFCYVTGLTGNKLKEDHATGPGHLPVTGPTGTAAAAGKGGAAGKGVHDAREMEGGKASTFDPPRAQARGSREFSSRLHGGCGSAVPWAAASRQGASWNRWGAWVAYPSPHNVSFGWEGYLY